MKNTFYFAIYIIIAGLLAINIFVSVDRCMYFQRQNDELFEMLDDIVQLSKKKDSITMMYVQKLQQQIEEDTK